MCLRRTRAAFLCLCWCRWGGIGGVSTAGVPWRSGPCWLGPRAPGGPAASSAVFPEVTADDSKQWLSSDSWLTWRYEAVIPALWMQWALLWDWVTDEGFSSQSVTRATASSSSCGGPAARVPLVERCFVRRPSGWSLAGGLVSMSSYSGHPSSPNVTVSTVTEKPAIQSQAKALVTESTSKDHFIYSLQIILTV